MATHSQEKKYGHVGNEKLLPLALEGDAGAIAVLADRGNTVTAQGKLRKEVTNPDPTKFPPGNWNTRVIENGKIVEQDGVPVTGNISTF